MIRNLMQIANVNVDAEKKAGVELKRGMFVVANEATQKLDKAADLAAATGLVVRDVVVTDDVANGFPVSEYEDAQDIVKVGEFAGHRALLNGEQWATDQVKASVVEAEVVAGKYLAVENGVLIASPSNAKTILVSLGYMSDAGHKVLAFKVVK